MHFKPFVEQAKRIAQRFPEIGLTPAQIMDVMEPLPVGLSWQRFIDIKSKKVAEIDAARFDEIEESHSAILCILSAAGPLRLKFTNYDGKDRIIASTVLGKYEISSDDHIVGRFVYDDQTKLWMEKALVIEPPSEEPTSWADMAEDETIPTLPVIAETQENVDDSDLQVLAIVLSRLEDLDIYDIKVHPAIGDRQKSMGFKSKEPQEVWKATNAWCGPRDLFFTFDFVKGLGEVVLFSDPGEEMSHHEGSQCVRWTGDKFWWGIPRIDVVEKVEEAVADLAKEEVQDTVTEDTIQDLSKKMEAMEDIQNSMTEEEYQEYDGDFEEGMTDEERGVEEVLTEKTRQLVLNTIGKRLVEKIENVTKEQAKEILAKAETIDKDPSTMIGELANAIDETVGPVATKPDEVAKEEEAVEPAKDVKEEIDAWVRGDGPVPDEVQAALDEMALPTPTPEQMQHLDEQLGPDTDDEEEEVIEVSVRRKSEWEKANPILRDEFLEFGWGKHTALAKLLVEKVDEGFVYRVSEDKIYTTDEYKRKKGEWYYPEYGVVFTKNDRKFLDALLDFHDSLEVHNFDEMLTNIEIRPRWKWLHLISEKEYEFTDKAVGEARNDVYTVTGSQELVDRAVEVIERKELDAGLDLDEPNKINVKLSPKIYSHIFAAPEDKLYDLDDRKYVEINSLGPGVTGHFVGGWCTANPKLIKRAEQIRYLVNKEFLRRS